MNKNKNLSEQKIEQCNDESKMAKMQLKNILKNAQEIVSSIESCDELDAWIQSYLTKADDYLEAIRKYVVFGKDDSEATVLTPTPMSPNNAAVPPVNQPATIAEPIMPPLDGYEVTDDGDGEAAPAMDLNPIEGPDDEMEGPDPGEEVEGPDDFEPEAEDVPEPEEGDMGAEDAGPDDDEYTPAEMDDEIDDMTDPQDMEDMGDEEVAEDPEEMDVEEIRQNREEDDEFTFDDVEAMNGETGEGEEGEEVPVNEWFSDDPDNPEYRR